MPLANSLVDPTDPDHREPRYPLAAARCTSCGLMRLSVVVDPTAMFTNYLYATSASAPMVAHFEEYAKTVVRRFSLSSRLVVEIGSNDGVFLRPLAASGARPLGVEPAANLARTANDAGLPTVNAFFTTAVARRVREEHGAAAAVLASNVLAHIDDLGAVLDAWDVLLAPDGVIVVEVPYLVDLLDHVEYDTIYHEHLSYFSVASLSRLFRRGGFELFDAERLPVHGGSLRAYARRDGSGARHERLDRLLASEQAAGLDSDRPFREFAERVVASRKALRSLLADVRGSAARVAALGATAKGNTLLNYCDLDTDDIEFVADSTPMKQGLLTPGTRIPIRPEATLLTERPDYTLLLAWNYADDILARFGDYTGAGGHFIHPIPLARVIP